MPNSNYKDYQFFELFSIFLTICMVTSFRFLFNESIYSIIIRISIVLFFVFFVPYLKKDLDKLGTLYCISITLGFVFHRLCGVEVKFFGEVLTRIVPILIILHYGQNVKYSNNIIRNFTLTFFVVECIVAIYERLTLTHLIDYQSAAQAMNVEMYYAEDFRSFSLIGHPLWNANVVSIILAFIFCSKSIKLMPKIILVLLGLLAIWSFNSRAALMFWMFLIIFRLIFLSKDIGWWMIVVPFILIMIPDVLSYLHGTGVLGRLNFNFSDNSTMSRFMAIQIFLSYPWTEYDIILGGVVLKMPVFSRNHAVADYVTIENGFLADLGYWGFFLGSLKIVGEIGISYMALKNYAYKDRFFIMAAMWGIASMNNNTYFTFLMPFYMCSYLSFGINQNTIKDNHNDNSILRIKTIVEKLKNENKNSICISKLR